MIVADVLEPKLAPTVTGLGYELVGIERQQSRRGTLLRVYIDANAGISLGDCEKVSKHLGDLLAVDNLMAGEYFLEVSSPGVDRLLFKPAHFQKFIGSQVQVRLRVPRAGQRNFLGLIAEADANTVRLGCGDEVYSIDFASIERARLVPTWNLVAAKPGRTQRKKSG